MFRGLQLFFLSENMAIINAKAALGEDPDAP
jgi:hypothetical protein